MNPQGQDPQMVKAQAEDQLRVITFLHGQKQALMNANTNMVNAIISGKEDLITIFPPAVLNAYLDIINVQNNQLSWEIEKTEREMGQLQEFVTQITEQLNSRIFRVTPTAMPTPSGPRNIR
jgi:hypothetical protein